ncbi:unnamed protein product [Linum trigynum]|uniref:Uncharacterized protein n=1 Tax=Linum trigynum TaxID=586398 RepID=A0AAV2DAH6_9ROSI
MLLCSCGIETHRKEASPSRAGRRRRWRPLRQEKEKEAIRLELVSRLGGEVFLLLGCGRKDGSSRFVARLRK